MGKKNYRNSIALEFRLRLKSNSPMAVIYSHARMEATSKYSIFILESVLQTSFSEVTKTL